MSEVTNISVVAREKAGKGEARATRREGLVPGVIYGDKQTPVTVAVNPRSLWSEMNRAGFRTRLFTVQVEGGKTELCLCRDVQRHVVSGQPIHVDFQRVSSTSKVHVKVPVHFANQDQSEGLKHGGVLNIIHHELEITVPAGSIPNELIVDLTGSDIGAVIHQDAIKLPEGAHFVSHEKSMTIATISAPTVAPAGEDEAEAAAAAAAAAASAAAVATPSA